MIILGIDPGTTAIGYAVVEARDGSFKLNAADMLKITSRDAAGQLKELNLGLSNIIKRWRPDAAAVEKLFFAKNQKTALAVTQARGVILLTTALAGLKFYEYTPLEIKMAVTGDGRADKEQVKKMVRLILGGEAPGNKRDDVFDAVAAALCCHQNIRMEKAKRSNLW